MDDRNFILNRLKSRRVSIEEFNFDALQAPPLSWFLSPQDDYMLTDIAHSLRLSAKPEIRYQEIDSLLRARGLVKFGAGTNRVVYRHPEFQDILFKIAADDVGRGDNPAEFKNQLRLKPFVSKIFEVSPTGTIAVTERLVPIKSREEFLSVSDDIFTLLNEFILGTNIMADIGSKYFMNYGTREGFGICILDYPYLYELDGNKLYCRKPDPLSQTSKCDGVIDYDDGYNHLVCTKCGAKYKAKELKKDIDSNEIKLVKEKGEYTMNIKISGGSKNIAETQVSTNQDFQSDMFKSTKNSVPNKKKEFVKKTVNGVNTESKKVEEVKPTEDLGTKILHERIKGDTNKAMENVVLQTMLDTSVENKNKSQISDSTAAMILETDTETPICLNTTGNGLAENSLNSLSRISSPISISEDIQKEALANKEPEAEKNPNDLIDDAIRVIADNINKISIDAVKYSFIERIIKTLVEDNVTNRSFEILMKVARQIYLDADDDAYEEICTNTDMVQMFKKVFKYSFEMDDCEYDKDEDCMNLNMTANIGLAFEADLSEDERRVIDSIEFTEKISEIKLFDLHYIDGIEDVPETKEPAVEEEEENVEDLIPVDVPETPSTISFYDAKVTNINNIFPSQSSKKGQNIIVFMDSNGDYVANNNGIIAADIVNDMNLNDVEICSSNWVEKVNKLLGDEVIEEENEEKTAPVGAVAPAEEVAEPISVADFVAAEESEKTEE